MQLVTKEAKEAKRVTKVNKMVEADLFIQSDGFKKYWVEPLEKLIKQYETSITNAHYDGTISPEHYAVKLASDIKVLSIIKAMKDKPINEIKMLEYSIKTLGSSE
jgi:hypothetical protein